MNLTEWIIYKIKPKTQETTDLIRKGVKDAIYLYLPEYQQRADSEDYYDVDDKDLFLLEYIEETLEHLYNRFVKIMKKRSKIDFGGLDTTNGVLNSISVVEEFEKYTN